MSLGALQHQGFFSGCFTVVALSARLSEQWLLQEESDLFKIKGKQKLFLKTRVFTSEGTDYFPAMLGTGQ